MIYTLWLVYVICLLGQFKGKNYYRYFRCVNHFKDVEVKSRDLLVNFPTLPLNLGRDVTNLNQYYLVNATMNINSYISIIDVKINV
jgi:hypothetical protein